jgi:hypothetical protein
MFIAAVLLVVSIVGPFRSMLPEKYQDRNQWILAVVGALFGLANLLAAHKASLALVEKVDRYGTNVNWQASEATLDVPMPAIKRRKSKQLTVSWSRLFRLITRASEDSTWP